MSTNPQKILNGRYQVVPRSIIFLFSDGQVLLQKGGERKKIYPGLYNGIGGHIERGEDVLSGAKRELQEETGLICSNLKLAGTISIDVHENEGILLFVFSGSSFNGELQHSDEGTLHWVDINEIQNLATVEDIQELVANTINSKKTGTLFYGKYQYTDKGIRVTTWSWS